MASGGATVTGLAEARRAVERFPDEVTATMKGVASRTANRIAKRAAEILRSKTHGTGRTADSIKVFDESDRKQFFVDVLGDPQKPKNLPLWLERGTRFMAARPYFRPAVDEAGVGYEREMRAAVEDTAAKTLGPLT